FSSPALPVIRRRVGGAVIRIVARAVAVVGRIAVAVGAVRIGSVAPVSVSITWVTVAVIRIRTIPITGGWITPTVVRIGKPGPELKRPEPNRSSPTRTDGLSWARGYHSHCSDQRGCDDNPEPSFLCNGAHCPSSIPATRAAPQVWTDSAR